MIAAHGTVRDGALKLKDRRAFDDSVGKLPDGAYVLSLEDEKEYRSSRANRFYWSMVVKGMSDHLGYTPDEVHELLKYKHHRRTVTNPQTGEMIEVGMSTASMTKESFAEYVDACIRWAAELGIYINTQEEYI